MPSIKHLRPQSTVMISDAGVKRNKVAIATGEKNDVLLGLTVSYSDGSGEELIGIRLSDQQLERLKQDIVLYQESQKKACQSDRQTSPVYSYSEPKPSSFIFHDGLRQANQQSSQQKPFNPFASPNVILKLAPKLVAIKNLGNFFEASVSFPALGTINPEKLTAISRTETEARMELDKKFQELVYSVVIKHG